MGKREIALSLCKIAGYHNDRKTWTRAFCENRISRQAADEAWLQGVKQKENGIKCDCYKCKKEGLLV